MKAGSRRRRAWRVFYHSACVVCPQFADGAVTLETVHAAFQLRPKGNHHVKLKAAQGNQAQGRLRPKVIQPPPPQPPPPPPPMMVAPERQARRQKGWQRPTKQAEEALQSVSPPSSDTISQPDGDAAPQQASEGAVEPEEAQPAAPEAAPMSKQERWRAWSRRPAMQIEVPTFLGWEQAPENKQNNPF